MTNILDFLFGVERVGWLNLQNAGKFIRKLFCMNIELVEKTNKNYLRQKKNLLKLYRYIKATFNPQSKSVRKSP